jgi:hypothetical protein
MVLNQFQRKISSLTSEIKLLLKLSGKTLRVLPCSDFFQIRFALMFSGVANCTFTSSNSILMATQTKHMEKKDELDSAFYKIMILVVLIGLVHFFMGM